MKQSAILEAVLFASGDPIESGRLAQALGVPVQEIPAMIQRLEKRYTETNSALQILHLEKAWQLAVKQ